MDLKNKFRLDNINVSFPSEDFCLGGAVQDDERDFLAFRGVLQAGIDAPMTWFAHNVWKSINGETVVEALETSGTGKRSIDLKTLNSRLQDSARNARKSHSTSCIALS